MKIRLSVASLLFVTMFAMSPTVRAELIAYEGFGYPAGYLDISDGGDNSADPTFDEGVFDHLDDGTSGLDPVTGLQPTVLGDPGRNGGDGTWVTSWSRRQFSTDKAANQIDDTKTLSYTDSQGKSLETTMGQPVLTRAGGNIWRAFDAASLGSDITMPNNDDADYDVPRLGKQDTTIWMSFLGDRSAVDPVGNWFVGMQFLDKQYKKAAAADRTGGIFRGGDEKEWLIWDAALNADPIGPDFPNGQDIPGSLAADDDDQNGDVFIVVKLDYSATNGAVTDGYADVSIFIDPDLGSTEPTSPALTASTYTAFNGLLIVSNPPLAAETTSSIDEIRFGTTYGDVAPIAGGVVGEPGDYDNDGFVGQSDLDLVLLNWGVQTPPIPAGWVNEQPSGQIGQAQLDGVLLNWGNGSSTVGSVPEPSSLLLLSIAGALGFMRRR